MKEIWKWIPRYRGLYKSSNLGRVRSVDRTVHHPNGDLRLKGRILKPHPVGESGHLFVVLSKNGKTKTELVHRLVLEAFVGSCPSGMECRHFPDRDPTNNRWPENIQWGTPKRNQKDREVHGTTNRGENHGNCHLSYKGLKKVRRLLRKGIPQSRIARIVGIGQPQVCRIHLRQQRKYG